MDGIKLITIIAVLVLAFWVINSQQEHLVAFSELVARQGFLGHVVFFGLFLWVALPFGYNWSTLVMLIGFAFGWVGLVDVYVGTTASSVMCYCGTQRYLKDWSKERLSRLSFNKQLYIKAAVSVIESKRAGCLMQIVLRAQPIGTFGLTNTFFGAMTELPVIQFLATTLIGMTYNILTMVSVGVTLRSVGTLEAAMKSGDGRLGLIMQICMGLLVIVGLFIFLRYLTVRVLPRMVDIDAVVEVPEEAFATSPKLVDDDAPVDSASDNTADSETVVVNVSATEFVVENSAVTTL